MITRILAIASLLLFGLFASAAEGATAISYSEVDNTYGWCAGYSTSEAPGCAKRLCEQSNGQDCKLALVCDAGWNAVAFADSDEAVGFGASCDMGSAYDARVTALASCIVHSRTLCWTNSTFNGGGDERSANENGDFDVTWYVQGLLHGLGYDPGVVDGEFGGKTRSAIRAFQADIGIEQTGEATEDLLYILLAKIGGITLFAGGMEGVVDAFSADEKSRLFSASYAPLPAPTFSDELSFRNTAVQRILLADYLRFNDRDCPMPATRTERTDPANGIWTVTCSNGGSYTLALSADGKSDTIADNNQQPEPEPETEVAQNDPKPEPQAETNTANPGIAFAHSAPDDGWWVCIGETGAASECAVRDCTAESNGTACETVLTCADRSWSAAAISPDDLRGMGFSCGYLSAYGAREVALAECLHKTRAICTLTATIDPDGNVVSEEDDAAFTRTYAVQAMLAVVGYYTDVLSGEDSPATRDAVTKLQTALGIETTGVLDEDLYWLAYYGVLGKARYVSIMSRDIFDKMDPATADYHYGNSARPAEEVKFSDELAAFSDDQRRIATAAAISAIDDAFCTMPAESAEPDGNGGWIVDCAEGRVALTFTGYDMTVTNAAATPAAIEPEPPATTGKEKNKGPAISATPPTGKTKG